MIFTTKLLARLSMLVLVMSFLFLCVAAAQQTEGAKPNTLTEQEKKEGWKLLFDGKIDPIKGIMARKFKLDGDMGKVMRYTKAALELVATTREIPTRYLDE